MGPEVAVAVVSWNTRDLLAACLESLAACDAEVWVVDNASEDGSADLVAERFPAVRLVRLEENRGFGAAVNLVAAATSTPWLAIANADVAVQDGALEALLDAGADDQGAGALAPRLVRPDGSTEQSVRPFPTLGFAVALNVGVVPARWPVEGRWDPSVARRVDWAVGAFLLVRRAAWDAVGGFDERQWMYAEDLDLGWRLQEAGWATRYVPGARVVHHGAAATSQAWGDDREERWTWSTYAWLLRRRGAAATRAQAAVNVAGASARWGALAIAARARPARYGWRRDRARRWARLHRIGLAPRDRLQRHR